MKFFVLLAFAATVLLFGCVQQAQQATPTVQVTPTPTVEATSPVITPPTSTPTTTPTPTPTPIPRKEFKLDITPTSLNLTSCQDGMAYVKINEAEQGAEISFNADFGIKGVGGSFSAPKIIVPKRGSDQVTFQVSVPKCSTGTTKVLVKANYCKQGDCYDKSVDLSVSASPCGECEKTVSITEG